MKFQWLTYLIVAFLSIAAGVAIAGLPDDVPVEETIIPPSTTEVPESTIASTTTAPPETTIATTVVPTTAATTTTEG